MPGGQGQGFGERGRFKAFVAYSLLGKGPKAPGQLKVGKREAPVGTRIRALSGGRALSGFRTARAQAECE